ncbi:MAG TPA: NYN domain-containing protein, partial [Vicinamibacteria bacterium]|nr:NYN domain-containing protein [Vicinamibacteria bacterium]
QKSVGGKNSADIRLVVDAMDMSFQKEHINCFVVASGDSDFSPLVSKLKENNKYVIGLGVKNSTSDLLIENCDEFIFYEDLVRGQERPLPQMGNLPGKLGEAFGLLVDSVLALQRENKEVLWGSMVKETMKRKKPSFNETYYGFRTFSHLLEDAQKRGIVVLRRDQRSGSYVVEDLGTAATVASASARAEAPGAAPRSAGELRAVESRPAEPREPRAAEAGEAPAAEVNGRPRRRRSRTRRPRAAAGQAAPSEAAPLDEHAPEGEEADAEGSEDFDQSAEGSDDHAFGAGSHETGEGASSESDAGHPEPADPAEPAPATETQRQDEDRGFSLFSWIRRDPDRRDD